MGFCEEGDDDASFFGIRTGRNLTMIERSSHARKFGRAIPIRRPKIRWNRKVGASVSGDRAQRIAIAIADLNLEGLRAGNGSKTLQVVCRL